MLVSTILSLSSIILLNTANGWQIQEQKCGLCRAKANRLRKGPSPSIAALSGTLVMQNCGEEMSDRLLKMVWEGKHTASRTTEN